MQDRDKALLNRIQSDFSMDPRPFAAIGRELGMDEEEVLERMSRLKEEGVVRRVGGNFTPDRLGFVSTLCAARVPEDQVDAFAEAVNAYPGVTHNYERHNDAYNVWFTFISPSMEEIETNLEQIRRDTGVTQILNLPATRVFKIRAQFKL